jgi:hypothetical protein
VIGDAATVLGPTADVSHRHTFGVSGRGTVNESARRTPWHRPNPTSKAVNGEAVTGSLLGVDLALAPKRLRRLANNTLPGPPRLNPNDTDTIVDTVALLNPRLLTNADLAAIGGALNLGRERVRSAARNPDARDALAAGVGMSGVRRQLLTWTADHAPDQVERLFSVSETFWIGTDAGAVERMAAEVWGMSREAMTGCYCLWFPPAGSWDTLVGRESTKQLGSAIVDVNLRVAGLLADAKVPAPLFAGVMTMAIRDYLDTVPALYFDDWEAISTHAWSLTRERVEDYVSAVVASGPARLASSAATQ